VPPAHPEGVWLSAAAFSRRIQWRVSSRLHGTVSGSHFATVAPLLHSLPASFVKLRPCTRGCAPALCNRQATPPSLDLSRRSLTRRLLTSSTTCQKRAATRKACSASAATILRLSWTASSSTSCASARTVAQTSARPTGATLSTTPARQARQFAGRCLHARAHRLGDARLVPLQQFQPWARARQGRALRGCACVGIEPHRVELA
jgi:hypothetical protein